MASLRHHIWYTHLCLKYLFDKNKHNTISEVTKTTCIAIERRPRTGSTISFTTQVMPLPPAQADFTGKTVIVTGASSGIGREAARHFVQLNAKRVILGCRDSMKGQDAKNDIINSARNTSGDGCEIQTWPVDLESFESVRAFCDRAGSLDRLDIVVENAGLLSQQYQEAEGYERLCTVNVISTWLMALLLLPILKRTKAKYYTSGKDKRIESDIPHLCVVGSNAHFYSQLPSRDASSIFEAMRGGENMSQRYADTKLISVLVMREMAERMSSDDEAPVVLNMVDPGYCKSDLLRDGLHWRWHRRLLMAAAVPLLARSPEMGARNYIWAVSAGSKSHGCYIEDCGLSTPAPIVDSTAGKRLQHELFDKLCNIIGGTVAQGEPGPT
ncbi:short-chain dehydrogenase/reductase-like protein [Xylariaceae sp. FL1019]|nr:short-chain dehydrogenase/reductase-like protein [Xylariaceae sp. FL1019]